VIWPDHFTVADILRVWLAILVFPLFLIAPGYVLGWSLDLVEFRRQTIFLRYLLSLCFSVALTPIAVYLLEHIFSIPSVWIFYWILWISFAILAIRGKTSGLAGGPLSGVLPSRIWKPIAIISSIWIALVIFCLVDLQVGHRLYISVVAYDYSIRSAAVSQLARESWLPPSSPFFHPAAATPFRYHYFWFLICSLPDRMTYGAAGSRHVLIAGAAWIGFALMAMVALYLRLFSKEGATNIRRRVMVALGLLSITGLDIIPTVGQDARHLLNRKGEIFASIDWWNNDQVTGWLDSVVWVPHHVAGLIACLTAFLILWVEWQRGSNRMGWRSIVGASAALASAAGLSVYVTFSFGVFLVVWALITLVHKNYGAFLGLVAVGVLMTAAASGFLLELTGAGSNGTTGTAASFARLGIRMFMPAHHLLFRFHQSGPWVTSMADLVSLPLNLWLELGALLVASSIRIRQWIRKERPFGPTDFAGATMAGVSLLICLFVRSNTIETNDLGMRGMLIVQFVLLLWTTDVLTEWKSSTHDVRSVFLRVARPVLIISIGFGVASNAYELFLLRGYAIATDLGMQIDRNLIAPGEDFAERAFYTRAAYEWLDGHIPLGAVEQHDPFHQFDHLPGLYSNRQMELANPETAVAFGANPLQAEVMKDSLEGVFYPRLQGSGINAVCRKWGIDYLIARSEDRAWRDKTSWVWTRKPLFSNPGARAFACVAEK
jgi:hypothetical protein